MSLDESIVEDAAPNWFWGLEYALVHVQEIAPGEAAAERANFGQAFLLERVRPAVRLEWDVLAAGTGFPK